MDPITGGLLIAGLGAKLFGGFMGSSAAKENNEAQRQAIAAQQEQDRLRNQQNHVMASRLKLENLRRSQQAAALATINFSAQAGGADFSSSSIQTGRAQIRSQAGYNEEGVNTSLMFNDKLFAQETVENSAKMRMSDASMKMQEANAFSAFGSDLLGAMVPAGRLFSGPSKG